LHIITATNSNGYKIILKLHNESNETEFKEARSLITPEFYQYASSNFFVYEQALKETEAFLNLTFGQPHANNPNYLICHSLTLFFSDNSFYIRDTAAYSPNNCCKINSLNSINNTRDAVLYKKNES
jgi:hypothetical protein